MNHSLSKRTVVSLVVVAIALLAVGTFSMVRATNTPAGRVALSPVRAVSTSVNIVNNSSREIRNVYLSRVDLDDWSNDQLNDDASIAPGQSFNLTNVGCDQQQVKVIGEDADGCFASTVVNCGDSATWTITNDTARDCGSN